MRNKKFPLLRLALPLICAVLFTFGSPWSFQMESVFGQVPSAPETETALPFWANDPIPRRLAHRSDLPALRAVTYNLHSGLGPKWRLFTSGDEVRERLRAIARRIAEAAPRSAPVDVIGLNEVDFGSRRSGWFDQAAFLASELRDLTGQPYRAIRGETWRRDVPGAEVRFGNAILVRHPVLEEDARTLGAAEFAAARFAESGPLSRLFGEKRGVVRARIDFHGHPVEVLSTHLEAFVLKQREVQAAEIVHRHVPAGVPTVLLGDINAVPATMTAARQPFAADRTHDILNSGPLVDARVRLAARRGIKDLSAWATYPAAAPVWPLDAAFATAELLPRDLRVIGAEESDHRGLFVAYGWLDAPAAARYASWHDDMRRRQLAIIVDSDLGLSSGAGQRRLARLAATTGFGDLMTDLMQSLEL